MKSKKRNIDKFLQTYIPSPSTDDMEADGARVLRRLKAERRNAPSGSSPSSSEGDSLVKVSRPWWQPVAAAVLIGIVGIGLYAAQRSGLLQAIFPVQRVSPPQAVRPTAPESDAFGESSSRDHASRSDYSWIDEAGGGAFQRGNSHRSRCADSRRSKYGRGRGTTEVRCGVRASSSHESTSR